MGLQPRRRSPLSLLALAAALGLSSSTSNSLVNIESSLFVRAEEEAAKKDGDDDDDDLDAEDETPAEPEEAVVTLTDDNYEEAIKKNEKMIIEFYAPWCGHCKALTPEYEGAAQELKKRGRKTVLAKVDATVHSKSAGAHNVQGYPSLVYYDGGVQSEYNGPRQKDGIVAWVEKREKSALETCTEKSLKKSLEDNAELFYVVGRVKKKSGRHVALKKAAQKLFSQDRTEKMLLCAIFLPKDKDDKKDSSLVMIKTNATTVLESELETSFDGVWNTERVADWIYKSTYPKLGVYDAARYQPQKLSPQVPLIYAYPDGAVDEKVQKTLLGLDGLTKDYALSLLDLKEKADLAKNMFSVQDVTKPYLLCAKEDKKYLYKLSEEKADTAAAIKEYLAKLKKGEAKPHYKSEPEPEGKEDEVTVVVGANWDKIVMDPKKDVLMEYYAPWCGHCKTLQPKYNDLAKMIKDKGLDEKVVVAKMDATANESPEPVTGFPKLVFYPAVKNPMKKKAEYSGARETQAMYDFLLENAKTLEGMEPTSDGGVEACGKKKKKKVDPMVARDLERKKAAAKKAGKKEEL